MKARTSSIGLGMLLSMVVGQLIGGLSVGAQSSALEPGSVWAWGMNETNRNTGRLGDGTRDSRDVPVRVKGPAGVGWLNGTKAVDAGGSDSLALMKDDSVWTWGYEEDFPTRVKGPGGVGFLGGVSAVAAGAFHNLALKPDGTVWSWGRNHRFQLGRPGLSLLDYNVYEPPGLVPVPSPVKAIAAGYEHSLALDVEGKVWFWGDNETRDWELNSEDPAESGFLKGSVDGKTLLPVPFSSPDDAAVAIATGGNRDLALLSDGTVWQWGGKYGTKPQKVNFSLAVGQRIEAIAGATGQGLALLSDGTVRSWGRNIVGTLGNGTKDHIDVTDPVAVKGLHGDGVLDGITQIDGGGASHGHSLALRSDGTVWSWGEDLQHGLLGLGGTVPLTPDGVSLTPEQVRGPGNAGFLSGISRISAGYGHNVVIAGPRADDDDGGENDGNGQPATPALEISGFSIDEGHQGNTTPSFRLELTPPPGERVTVDYSSTDDTALKESDYRLAPGRLTFEAGQASAEILVQVMGDTAIEPDESFVLNLSEVTGATLAASSARGVIRNDDGLPSPAQLSEEGELPLPGTAANSDQSRPVQGLSNASPQSQSGLETAQAPQVSSQPQTAAQGAIQAQPATIQVQQAAMHVQPATMQVQPATMMERQREIELQTENVGSANKQEGYLAWYLAAPLALSIAVFAVAGGRSPARAQQIVVQMKPGGRAAVGRPARRRR